MTARKPKNELQKRGRKTDFRPEFIRIAEVAAKFGATEQEIAEELGVSRSNMNKWKVAFPEFQVALKLAKAIADDRVEHSLYQKAIGYQHEVEKLMTVSLRDGGSTVVREKYIEKFPPSDTAIIFFLKNRRPEQWRDVQRIDAAMGHYVLSETPMTEEQWIKERAIADKTIDVTPTVTPNNDDTK